MPNRQRHDPRRSRRTRKKVRREAQEVSLERFLSKTVDGTHGCLLWVGSDDGRQGYGKFFVDGKNVRAIRWIFELFNPGKLKKHHVVMHTCDSVRCVEPNHLARGTHRQNMKDKARKGRVVNVRKFLDEDTVSLIRFAHSLDVSPAVIAGELGLKYTTVRSITEGKRWKQVA
jgi:hypothetical protein